MMAMGGSCAAASMARQRTCDRIRPTPELENNAADVQYETDFRSVYAQVIDRWLGAQGAAMHADRAF